MSDSETAQHGGLERALGLWQVTASGVGIIIGAGIYVLIGDAVALAAARTWIAFMLAAGLSALTGLSYAELTSMYPKAGAEFEYSRQAFPAWIAFVVGWIMFTGLIVAAAAVSLGFGRYLGRFVNMDATFSGLLLLVLVGIVASAGIRYSARLTVSLSLVQVGGLLYVVIIGFPHVGQVDLLAGNGSGGGGVLAATALVFFAFIGFDEVITLAEETRNPTRIVPLALLLALGISAVLYVTVAITAVSVIGVDALAASERPLADVIDHALGGRGADVLAVIALTATTNTTLLCITASSRLQYGMASARALPSAFAKLGPHSRAPRQAIVVSVVVAGLFVLIGDLTLIASVTDLAVYLVFIMVNLTVVILRFRAPSLPRPFRSPVAIGRFPVLPGLGIVAVLVMIPSLRWEALVLGFGLCLLGVGGYAWFGRHMNDHSEA